MKKYSWKVVTQRLPINDGVPPCEFCKEPAPYVTKLMDDYSVVREKHIHCVAHHRVVVDLFESIRRAGLTPVVRERHWMHIWKVGHKSCSKCPADSRVVESLVDESGEIVAQILYCEIHVPSPVQPHIPPRNLEDVIEQTRFELGTSFSPDLLQSHASEKSE